MKIKTLNRLKLTFITKSLLFLGLIYIIKSYAGTRVTVDVDGDGNVSICNADNNSVCHQQMNSGKVRSNNSSKNILFGCITDRYHATAIYMSNGIIQYEAYDLRNINSNMPSLVIPKGLSQFDSSGFKKYIFHNGNYRYILVNPMNKGGSARLSVYIGKKLISNRRCNRTYGSEFN